MLSTSTMVITLISISIRGASQTAIPYKALKGLALNFRIGWAGLAEKYVRAVQKVLNRGLVYFKLDDSFYRVKAIRIEGSNARFDCESLQNGEEYEVSFKIEEELMADLLRFGLEDKPNSVFIISEDVEKPVWFETSLTELIEGLRRQGVKRDLRRELAAYEDLEEEA